MYNMTKRVNVLDMVYIAMFAVLIAICSWIYIPTAVPFTLQTFAVFAAVGILGGKRGTIAVGVYILLGAIGVPVFAQFQSGFGVLFGFSGGYILGFLFAVLLYWLITHIFGAKIVPMAIAMILGLFVCYTFGTVWFMYVFSHSKGPVGLLTALGWCVFPFVIPDLVKIVLAILLSKRLSKYVGR